MACGCGVFVQLRAKDAEHEEEIVQIKQKVGQDQRFSIFKHIVEIINEFCNALSRNFYCVDV